MKEDTAFNICAFGASSSNIDKIYISEAERMGKILSENGYGLVFGGGRTGLMGACARGVTQNSGRIIGVIPEKLNLPGIAYEYCSELIVTKTMHERKSKMESLSAAYIALAGGFGTLEELMEVITLKQLGYISSPIAILNTRGYYDKLIEQFANCVKEGFTSGAYLDLFKVCATPEEVIEYINSYEIVDLPDKIKEVLKT